MKFSPLLLAIVSGASVSSALELTSDTYDATVAGKTVFLKFYAPWCGHCKKLAPDWEKLEGEFADSKTQLVASVDCTTDGGKPLCEANGVRGYPSLKWGDPSALEDYKGGRDLDSLTKFAKENLKPVCSPSNLDLCDDDKKAEIEKFQKMSEDDLDKLIKEKEGEQAKIEEDFKKFVEGLQNQYQEAMEKKDKDLEEVKKAGLGLMKAVKATKGASTEAEL